MDAGQLVPSRQCHVRDKPLTHNGLARQLHAGHRRHTDCPHAGRYAGFSAVSTIAQLATGILAAYAFARWTFRFDKLVYSGADLVPFQVVMISNYLLVAQLGLLDSVMALILPNLASALAILLLAQAMRGFPREVIEAARIDGAGNWRILWEVPVPNMRGTIASLAILIFISTWNEYFWPLLLSRNAENSVIQIGIQMFMTQKAISGVR